MTTYHPVKPSGNANVSGKSALVEFFELAVGIFGALLVIYFLLGMALNIIIDKLPNEFEGALAKMVNEEDFESPYYFVEAEIAAQDLLNKIAQREFKDQKFKVHIANDIEMNAFALPGGRIIINAGLMKELKTQNQLAFVLAHELGHYKNRDHLRALGRQAVFAFLSISLFGSESGITEMFTSSLDLLDAKFSQQQEAAADEFAVDMLHRFYGHVSGAVEFFNILSSTQGSPKYLDFVSTHPLEDTRIEMIKGHIQSKGYQLGQEAELDPIIFRTYLFDK